MSAPWLDDGDVQLYHGDACEVLRSLPAGSVQTCVTSPPYWGLRDYGTGSWTGGTAACDHRVRDRSQRDSAGGFGNVSTRGTQPSAAGVTQQYGYECGRCGARRVDAQLGLEASPQEYVASLVAVFAEVWRVLRADGTLWLNLGDSYASSPSGQNGTGKTTLAVNGWMGERSNAAARAYGEATPQIERRPVPPGLKAKDLVGVPWRVAFALQEAGWYLRSDIIWAKPNPMPESVTDRPTKAHEYVFLLAKQPRYYYDADAIREDAAYAFAGGDAADVPALADAQRKSDAHGMNGRNVQATNSEAQRRDQVGGSFNNNPRLRANVGRNARSVWEIATQPTPDAHFATFPEALVRRCILAGSREGDQVLDPFVGSGTTCLVARKHGRRAIGVDLSEAYLAIAARRLGQQSLFATSEGAA